MWENSGDGGDPRDGEPRAIYGVSWRQRGVVGLRASPAKIRSFVF
jgi:hypothetical protein